MTGTPLPSIAYLALGGTIASVTSGDAANRSGAVPRLDAQHLVSAVPEIAEVARVDARQLALVPSPSLGFHDVQVALQAAHAAVRDGASGVVLSQGTDTIEETAYLLDLAWDRPEPLVLTGAMRHASAPGADGPANLLAAVCVAAHPSARERGVLVVLDDQVHAASTVRKTHTFSTGAFASPGAGPLGWVAEGVPVFRSPAHQMPAVTERVAPLPPMALHRVSLDDDGRVLDALGDLGYRGAVVEGFGGGHVAERTLDAVRALARKMPVVMASRTGAGTTLATTYGFPGSEIDLLDAGLVPAGQLDGLKARLLLAVLLSVDAPRDRVHAEFLARGGGSVPPQRR
ncbi:asparaginase [Curtobacterium sp. VKM Ac-2922]|uniref:asparaginase n=1 Tax=Curtobacterium sp. VKM Ac-2922 TaxID=2929475 RepID=UPI001FB204F5|nr:asparaginase [Curtobacterium sp. VKM Ac-2922]MCJ1714386.1 asparaginase [Curtobacterium sp. VKM Ac-2922]